MIKKIIPVFLCICLSFAVICYGENPAETHGMQMPPQGEIPPMGEMPQMDGMPPTWERPSNGEMPSRGEIQKRDSTTQPSSALIETEQPANQETEDIRTSETTAGDTLMENQPSDVGQRGQGRTPSFGQTQQQNPAEKQGFFEKYFDAVASVILLMLAYIFVILYKRRQY